MKKSQRWSIIILTLTIAVFLAFYVGYSIRLVNERVAKACFDDLKNASLQLGNDLYRTTDMDRTILEAMADVIAGNEDDSQEKLCEIMGMYDTESSYVNYVELLDAENRMLDADGSLRDVSGKLDFASEAARGAYVSNIEFSTSDAEERIIRNAVPVIRDGKTVYMLYGVVRLSTFAQTFRTNIYDGKAYVYLLDGDTGDFLLDTWHKSFGNISEVSKRKMLPGFSFETAIQNMQQGIGGDLGFVSESTGHILYMHYEPIGINNWNIILTVEEQYALAEGDAISFMLYRMALIIGIVIVAYMIFVVILLLCAFHRIRELGMVDQSTGLQNRNAFDHYIATSSEKTFTSIACVYVDVNGLHEINNHYGHQAGDEMLKIVADTLKSAFREKEIYRIGGDEFVVLTEKDGLDCCTRKMLDVTAQIGAHDYSIAYGVVCRQAETGVGRVTHEADEVMLEDKRLYYIRHNRRQR